MAAADELNGDVLARIADDVPVVMVNLMKFRAASADGDGSGWDAYLRYSKQVSPLIKARGGAIIWAGTAHGASFGPAASGDWDYVALVRYPGKEAFRDMIVSPEYEAANVHRANGVERHTIIATEQAYGRFRED
ncbi:MAG: DUF1330 domain-containing protein [Pseudomonadota bacterium]|nr:DUF1330 domain-containing protein [Pseudomonadota bacterium]